MFEAIISLAALGLFFGALLGYAAKVFAVPRDEKAEAIKELLPGANCGACGYPGCNACAEAMAAGECTPEVCPSLQSMVTEKIFAIMGSEAKTGGDEKIREVARLTCHGGKEESKLISEYVGLPDCRAANMYAGGNKACSFACLGFGNCEKVCPFAAIKMNKNNLPEIDPKKCIACGKCVEECPKGVLRLMPENAYVYVACSSKDPAKQVTSACKVGCIACGICEKSCPFDAIHVIDNLAVIDYDKCTSCGICAEKCPRNIIVNLDVNKKKAIVIPEKCVGCGLCKKVCPVDAIEGETKEIHEVRQDKCIGCGVCVEKCPKDAIILEKNREEAGV